jgi:hypothetical protein
VVFHQNGVILLGLSFDLLFIFIPDLLVLLIPLQIPGLFGDLYLLFSVQAGEDGVAVDGGPEHVLGGGCLIELDGFDWGLPGFGFGVEWLDVLGEELLSELCWADEIVGLVIGTYD